MWGGTMSVTDGWLVSCCFGLLGTLLPFNPSWFLLSALMPSWSSSWTLRFVFFWHNYSFRSWFYLVRRFTVATRFWIYLLSVVVHGSSPWTLLMVAIERVSTMQLFVLEAIVRLISRKSPQTAPTDDAKKNHQWATQSLHACNYTCTTKREGLTKSTGVVLAKYHPKVKLELFTTLKCQRWGKLCVPWFVRVFEVFIVVEGWHLFLGL